MTEVVANSAQLSLTTKPGANGEAPLPKRSGPKGLLPSTWLERSVRVAYTDAYGGGAETSGVLLDVYPFGPILSLDGIKTAISWDVVRLVELVND
jgi:hypothetical protein